MNVLYSLNFSNFLFSFYIPFFPLIIYTHLIIYSNFCLLISSLILFLILFPISFLISFLPHFLFSVVEILIVSLNSYRYRDIYIITSAVPTAFSSIFLTFKNWHHLKQNFNFYSYSGLNTTTPLLKHLKTTLKLKTPQISLFRHFKYEL